MNIFKSLSSSLSAQPVTSHALLVSDDNIDISSGSATVTWNTDEPSSYWGDINVQAADAGLITFYYPGTYSIKIMASIGDDGLDLDDSAQFSIQLHPAGSPNFVLATDWPASWESKFAQNKLVASYTALVAAGDTMELEVINDAEVDPCATSILVFITRLDGNPFSAAAETPPLP